MSYLDTHGLETFWTKVKGLVSGKQDVISDLSTIRSNASAGAGKVSCTDSTVSGFGYLKKAGILDMFYPVGTIYETTVNTFNPNTSWGGTWVKIEGRMLLGSSSSYSIGSTGGSADATLPSHYHSIPALSGYTDTDGYHYHSIPELSGSTYNAGSHSHSTTIELTPNKLASGSTFARVNNGGTEYSNIVNIGSNGDHSHTLSTNADTTGFSGYHTHGVTTNASSSGYSGSSATGANMPPYQVVNIWKRTA